jgi:hypothetical protein
LCGIRGSILSLSSVPHENSVGFLMQNWERRYFKTVGNESLCANSNDSGVRVVHFTTSENLVVEEQNIKTFVNTIGSPLIRRLAFRLITY